MFSRIKLQLKIAEAVRTRQRGYKRQGPYVELTLHMDSSYEDVVKDGASLLGLDASCEGVLGPLTLFRCDGTVIRGNSLRVGGCEKWTISNYISLVSKSASKLKLCVGHAGLVGVYYMHTILYLYAFVKILLLLFLFHVFLCHLS